MRIVIHAPTIHSFIHPAGLPRSDTKQIAHGLTAALAGMGIRVEPDEIEILPDPKCTCRD